MTNKQRFIPFVRVVWPEFIEGAHHRIMAEAFERVADGKLRRLIVNIPPRHTKSVFASQMLPAWFLGQHPDRVVMQATHNMELSRMFGRGVHDLVSSREYQKVFPGVSLRKDQATATRWKTGDKGEHFVVCVGSAVPSIGADLFIIDDSVSEQGGAENDPRTFASVYEWYAYSARPRLNPGGVMVIVGSRLSKDDLAGSVIKQSMMDGADKWEVIEFPAILPSGRSLWSDYWSLEELTKIKNEISPSRWNANYMQSPSGKTTDG